MRRVRKRELLTAGLARSPQWGHRLNTSVDSPSSPESAPTQTTRTRRKARHRRRRLRRRLPRWLTIVGWIVVLPLGVVALMRIFAWDDVEVFAVLNTVSVFVYLPAWVVAVVAGAGRRYTLAAGALISITA